VASDLAAAVELVVQTTLTLPAALLHDVVTAPVRDWHVLLGVVTDTAEHGGRHPARHAADQSNRAPGDRADPPRARHTARAEHLDLLAQAIDRDDPDVGPLLLAAMEALAQRYGRDAVRLIFD
jgi:hypothetical protein